MLKEGYAGRNIKNFSETIRTTDINDKVYTSATITLPFQWRLSVQVQKVILRSRYYNARYIARGIKDYKNKS